MYQAREDKAVVGLFYEPRHIPLDLAAIIEEVETDLPASRLEQAKLKWAAVERAAGAQERLSLLAQDLRARPWWSA